MCGEKRRIADCAPFAEGSPPRVRGKEEMKYNFYKEHRITPACAGKSVILVDVLRPFRDHPRVCGEKQTATARPAAAPGSPPRVRGKDESAPLVVWYLGITPACAGKSGFPAAMTSLARDHPRVCGEKSVVILLCVATYRITPACAGKSSRTCFATGGGKDHPRVCGEKDTESNTTTSPALRIR